MSFSANSATNLPSPASCAGTPGAGRLIEDRLRRSSYLALQEISCEVRGGVLHLLGRVSSYYLKQVAQDLASQVAAGRFVNAIEVCTRPVGHASGMALGKARFASQSSVLISE